MLVYDITKKEGGNLWECIQMKSNIGIRFFRRNQDYSKSMYLRKVIAIRCLYFSLNICKPLDLIPSMIFSQCACTCKLQWFEKIHEITEYLELFLRNLLLRKKFTDQSIFGRTDIMATLDKKCPEHRSWWKKCERMIWLNRFPDLVRESTDLNLEIMTSDKYDSCSYWFIYDLGMKETGRFYTQNSICLPRHSSCANILNRQFSGRSSQDIVV